MKSDDTIVYVIGGAIAVIVGLILYNKYMEGQNPQAAMIPWKPPNVQMVNTAVSPTKYYSAPQAPMTLNVEPPIVQNEENVKWTDWLGRERVITISHKVH